MADIVKYQSNGKDIELSIAKVRQCLCQTARGASDEEIMQFITLCQFQRLNPFLKEAYLVKYGNQAASIIVSKDLFLKRAEVNIQYDGYENGIIVMRNGKVEYLDGAFSLPTDQIIGGWAKVFRKDRSKPVYKSVSFNEYVQKKNDGTPNSFWSGKPGTMIAKVPLMQAMREAFPSELSALYIEEEQGQRTVDTTAEVFTEQPKVIEVASEVIEEPSIKEWTEEEAKAKLKEAYGSNLFSAEEKAQYNESWKADWKSCIEVLVADYENRVKAMQSVA